MTDIIAAYIKDCLNNKKFSSLKDLFLQVDLSPAPDSAVSRIPQRTLTQVNFIILLWVMHKF